MAPLLLALLLFGVSAGQAGAIPSAQAVPSPGDQCRAAIAGAERTHAIPPQLMAAIGRVESGRRDPATGVGGAWPWTINAEGQGYYFDTKPQAIAKVEELRARGVRSIDVGCMQVNLMHHATAFPNLEQAFEPAVNADYAARFLVQLREKTGDWTKATAFYHSANPALGEPYAAKVMAVWPEEQRKAGASPAPVPTAPPAPGAVFAGMSPIFQLPPPRPALPLPTVSYGGQPGLIPGRGLDAYRAAPIRVVSGMPLLTMRVPPRLAR